MLAEGGFGFHLVAFVDEAVEERDGDRLDAFGLEVLYRGCYIFGRKRFELASRGIDTTGDPVAQVARHQHRSVGLAVVPLVLAQTAADLQRVPVALGGEEADGRALVFEHRVGGHRAAVHEERAARKELLDG